MKLLFSIKSPRTTIIYPPPQNTSESIPVNSQKNIINDSDSELNRIITSNIFKYDMIGRIQYSGKRCGSCGK